MKIINGLKRLLYGSTTYFTIKQGSVALRGISFVELYREQLEYPTTIVGIDIKMESNNKAEFRIACDGEKIFPFGDTNTVPDMPVALMNIEVAAGSLLTVEVKGMVPKDSFVVVLSEMDCIVKK